MRFQPTSPRISLGHRAVAGIVNEHPSIGCNHATLGSTRPTAWLGFAALRFCWARCLSPSLNWLWTTRFTTYMAARTIEGDECAVSLSWALTLVVKGPRTTRLCAAGHDTLATAAAHNFNARHHTRCRMGLARPAPATYLTEQWVSVGSIVFDPTTALHVSISSGRDGHERWEVCIGICPTFGYGNT